MKSKSLHMTARAMLFAAMLLGTIANADGVIRNLPGFLDVDPKTNPYMDGIPGIDNHLVADHDVDLRTPSRILHDDYIDNSGKFRIESVDLLIQKIQKREHDLFLVQAAGDDTSDAVKSKEGLEGLYANRNNQEAVAKSRFLQKWNSDKDRNVSAFAIDQLNKAKQMAREFNAKGANFKDRQFLNSNPIQPLMEVLFQGFQTYQGMISDSNMHMRLLKMIKDVPRALHTVSIGKNKAEALDLVDSGSTQFLGPDALTKRAKQGQDLSLLDPMADGLWSRSAKPISSFDTSDYDNSTRDLVGNAMLDPSKPIEVWFDKESEGRGITPKVTVSFGKMKYKLKLETPVKKASLAPDAATGGEIAGENSMENKTEHSANELAAALGFQVDPTYFKRYTKLYVTLDAKPLKHRTAEACQKYNQEFNTARQNMLTKLNSRYVSDAYHDLMGETGWDYRQELSDIQQDSPEEGGCKYVLVQNGSYTLRTGDNLKIGYFTEQGLGRPMKRAYRAVILFRALVNDVDQYDWNSAVELAGDKLRMTPTDMGQSWGNFLLANRVLDYSPRFVTRVDPSGEIHTTFLPILLEHPQFMDTITVNDAKWLGRLLGQLTEKQVKTAFLTAGHPDIVAEMYTQAFLHRRDDLLKAVGLMGASDGLGGTFSALSKITDPSHNYVVPGRESCYKGYTLQASCIDPSTDPNNNYTDRFRPKSFLHPDDSSIGQITTAAFNQAGATATGELGALGQNLNLAPQVKGVQTGLLGVLPFRESMPSPLGDNTSWVVDVYPCKIGSMIDPVSGRFDPVQGFSAAGGIFRLNYLAVVRATETPYKDDLKFYDLYITRDTAKTVLQECRTYTRAISEQLIDKMGPQDLLIAGHSWDVGGGPTVTAGVITDSLLFQKLWFQSLVLKKQNNQVVTTWLKGHEVDFNPIDAALGWSLERVPLVVASIKNSSEIESTYAFDWSPAAGQKTSDVNASRSELLESLNTERPDPSRFIHGREKNVNLTSFFASLVGLKSVTKNNQTTQIKTYSAEKSIDNVLVDTREKNSTTGKLWPKTYLRPINENVMRVRAAITSTGAPVASIEFSYEQDHATANDLEKLKNSVMKILPETFFPVSGRDANWYQVSLALLGDIYISGDGLQKIFSSSPTAAAEAMRAALKENNSAGFKALDLFNKRFATVQKAVQEMSSPDAKLTKEKINTALARALSSLLYIKEGGFAAVKALEILAGEANIHREAKLISTNAALPGQRYKIELNDQFKGQLPDKQVNYLKEELGVTHSPAEVASQSVSMLLVDFVNHANTVDPVSSDRYNRPQKSLIQDDQHPGTNPDRQ